MMNEVELRKTLPDQSSGSGQTFGTSRHPSVIDPILSKRVCFYKSGDPQFSGLRLVINNRTFKTFDALLDSLSKKVPLPFGVRNITTPRGIHAINSLDELKDGKSYICSDSRKVKPINLALARKKLPPWYHARPVSSRRRTIQQGRFLQGQSIHKQESVLIRTPKSLLVFRNGDPTVKHTVVLQKKTTPTYEAILEYISELMRFHVVKLHTPDGRRVDGVPGLILCSGTVVAVGREPFRPADYNSQKSPSPTWLRTKQMSFKRQKASNRKKKSRNFSSSSESYIVRQIHNTIAESSCDIHSNPTNSAELDSKRILESVAETDGDGAEGQDYMLPSDDNIEKSFQVNQDGSMTVEMKVRLTIKEEESIHWTTTVTRSSVSSQLNGTSLPESKGEQDICSPESNSLDLQSPAAIVDTINKDKTKDNNDDDPPSLGNGALSESSNEEENIKKQSDVVSSGRAPTPGYEQIGKKQASVESIKAVTEEGIQQEIVGSYSYREPTGNGTMTEQYCMVKQSSTRPVPKPRRLSSLDVNSKNVSGFKSTEMSEILQIESSGEEVTETIIHIYEQQTCQDNFFANVCTHPATTVGRPATSETGQLSQNNELECYRPSTASESISIWKTESMSIKSQKNGAVQGKNRQQQLQKPRKDLHQRETGMDKRTSSKPKAVNKHVQRLATPRKRQKQNTAEATRTRKKAKTFSSAGFIRRIYGNKIKSSKRVKILKKRPTQNGDRRVATKKSEVSDDTTRSTVKDSKVQSVLKKSTERVSFDTSRMSVSPNEVHQARRILTRQTSMHVEKRSENESYDITGSVLPAFNSSSTVTNEYVESWLQKAHLNPPSHSHDEHQKLEASTVAQTENGRCEEPENKHGLSAVEEEVKCSEIKTCQTSDPPPPPEGLLATPVKLRVQSFENKSSPSLENTRARHQIVHHHTTTKNTENWKNESQKEEINPPVPPSDKTSTETQLDSEVKNKSSSIRISFQKATPLNTLSMELPPPPPPAENTELSDTEYCMNDASSAVSSPLYRLSSVSSEGTDNNPLSISPTSGKAVSFRVNATAPPSRTPSTKRAPLVSNRSLERKMSLRKACVDKYALSSEAAPEETTLSTHTVGSDGVCSTERQQPIEAQTEEAHQSGQMSCPSCGTSASPTSLTSEEGLSSPSISSNDASVPSNIPFKERGMTKATQKEASTPKVLVKKAKVKTSPSPERKLQNQKSQDGSVQLSTEQSRPEDKTLSPKTGIQKHAASNGSPSAEKKQIKEPKQQKRHSPYSQSLDMVSPPVKHKSSRKLLSRDLSSDNPSEPATKRHKKTSVQRKSHQMPESVKSKSERDKPLTSDTFLSLETDQSIEKKKAEGEAADQETSMTDMQIIKPLTIANQPSMKPVLEKICYAIKSIRQMTQNKRPSCLEKSNSLPDFSSHVASTFGSSSRTLLAFLSVMTLKEGITNLNRDELNANNVSCAEALKMIDSLREIASIEDSHRLHRSLSNLQKSASKQLLQSWKGFQELSDRCKSRSSTPSASEPELITGANPEEEHITEENIIDELMDNLDVPEKLKEELASLSVSAKTECDIKELWPKESSDESTSNFSKEDAATVPDATQDDKADVEVRSSIIKLTDISQMQQCGEDRSYLITEEAKDNPIVQATKDNDPPVDSHSKLVTEERQFHSKASFAQEYKVDLHSCQGASAENIIEGEVTSEKNLENESGSDDEGQKMSSASKELAEKESCKHSVPSSEAGEQRGSEENESEAECEEMRQGSSETEDLSNPENHSEEEDGKLASPSYYVELNVREAKSISSLDSENQTEVKCTEMSKDGLSTPVCLSSSEKEEQSQTYSMGLNISAEESTGNSDMDKSSSEEEQPEAECKKLQVIAEESFSCIEEEEEEDMEEKQLHDLPDDRKQKKTASSLLSALTEEPNEDKVSSEDEDSYIEETYICDGTKSESRQSNLIENQVLEKDSLIGDRSNTDDDSGNDHNSYEEHVEEEQTKAEDEQISSSTEELSYYEKQPSSEEEQAHVDRYKGESRIAHQEAPAVATQSQATNSETSAAMLQHQSEEIMPQSVAERVILLEKRVADAEKRKSTTKSSAVRCYSQRKAHLDSDDEDSPCESLALCTRSAPQSSLSFSYDSSGVVTTEPEGSRVRSIREMFLAKSATDIQQTRFPSPRTSELELRAETSVSGGYQSQTSSEMSSGEDDLSKKSITKGFVRRTIERLYGKKDSNPDEEAGERPPFEPKQEKNGQSSIFAPFHTARSKAMSELSYFYSANALDTLSEATRCIAFNAQVGPGDSIPIDDGRWLLRDNTFIRKSVSDPIGINKTFTNTPEGKGVCEDTEDKTPYSLFATKPEPEEDKTKLFSRKCTYFSLPHASESDTCQDELSTASRNSANGDSIVEAKDNSEDTKTWAERNGMLPTMTDFKMMDNKVHPVIEPPPEDEVVVVQPGKGQGVVNRRLPEQDILDVLYNFCGQHCPLL